MMCHMVYLSGYLILYLIVFVMMPDVPFLRADILGRGGGLSVLQGWR